MTLSQVITAALLVLTALTARWVLGSGPLTIARIVVFGALACSAMALLVTLYVRHDLRAASRSSESAP